MRPISEPALQEKLQEARQFEPSTAGERQRLDQLWNMGRLNNHVHSLEKFYRTKREEFEELMDSIPEGCELLDLAKLLVVENIIIDHIAETRDQIREIESEIWIQGERGNHDRNVIANEWAKRHAAVWRQWRIKEYLYAVERMEGRLRECIGEVWQQLQPCSVN